MLKDVEVLTPKYIRSRIRSVKSFVPPLHIILLQTHSSLNSVGYRDGIKYSEKDDRIGRGYSLT